MITSPLRLAPARLISVVRLSLALLLAFLAADPASSAQLRPPNIVFILADDLGWADLGCYGNKFNETPHLDRLAAAGMRFTDFYAAAPVCSPTRASILSGQYPARYGLTAHIYGHWRPFEQLAEPPCALQMPLSIVTLAERLRDAGYATAHLGKWHLGGRGFGPKEQGFDTAIELGGHTVPAARQQPPGRAPKRTAEYLADKAIEFIEAHRAGPFYVQLWPTAVHIPLDTTPELQSKYTAKPSVPGYSCHPLYAGLLEEMDTSVGRVLATLDRFGLSTNTIVIFTSDNGGLEREAGGWPGTLNRPLRDEKGTLYEGGIRVPLIIRWPGVVKPGTVSSTPAVSVDFYPTLIEGTGLPLASGQLLDGSSLVPVLRNAANRQPRPDLYWHYPHYHHSRPSGAVRAGDWKAIEFSDTGEVELYNLKQVIGEAKNLVAAMPDKARELQSLLQRWRHEVNAQMPQSNPAHDPQRAREWWDRRTLKPTEAPGTYKPAG
jgi:uncharacterized sulfatase